MASTLKLNSGHKWRKDRQLIASHADARLLDQREHLIGLAVIQASRIDPDYRPLGTRAYLRRICRVAGDEIFQLCRVMRWGDFAATIEVIATGERITRVSIGSLFILAQQ